MKIWNWILFAIFLGICALGFSQLERNAVHLPPTSWTVGFWCWGGGNAPLQRPTETVDLLLTQIGTVKPWSKESQDVVIYEPLTIDPDRLPMAKRYAAVIRLESPDMKLGKTLPEALRHLSRLTSAFQKENRILDELQLDWDCPTGSLPEFAALLSEVRKQLPREIHLSITALLDWFRPGTAIKEVLEKVDSFVPQFYDVHKNDISRKTSIGFPVDSHKWGLVFDRFKVPYFIGVSSFGRIMAPEKDYFYRDVSVLEMMSLRTSEIRISSNSVGERVLDFKAYPYAPNWEYKVEAKPIRILQPTSQSIRNSFDTVRSMGKYCAGILFFRWPTSRDSIALFPSEIVAMIKGEVAEAKNAIKSVEGNCALVDCRDLYLVQGNRFPAKDAEWTIQSSTPLEYFVPGKMVKTTFSGGQEIKARIPAFNAAYEIFLGRAVAAKPTQYKITKTSCAE
jgi:hypothetical protein